MRALALLLVLIAAPLAAQERVNVSPIGPIEGVDRGRLVQFTSTEIGRGAYLSGVVVGWRADSLLVGEHTGRADWIAPISSFMRLEVGEQSRPIGATFGGLLGLLAVVLVAEEAGRDLTPGFVVATAGIGAAIGYVVGWTTWREIHLPRR